MKIFIDTGPVVAFLNKNDQHHSFVEQQMRNYPPPFYICEAVVTESFFLMSRVPNGEEKLIELLETPHIQLESSYSNQPRQIHEFVKKYSNIPMSFADACLVQMAEKSKDSLIFTIDRGFQMYRSSNGNPLSLISPY
ncbi:MAG: PIN domain-containing protein [Balneolaceae bacterium]|nr:MAG: PIN domain-containing protein [Balneolaceae bacterium]